MIKFQFFSVWMATILLMSCSVEPRDINYGQDHCSLCDMTVVDKTHAAEYVTSKGKVFTFDAVECLIRKINTENNENNLAFVLVADYNNPGTLVDAKKAHFLITEKIKSPMGANLSAFDKLEDVQEKQKKLGGEIYSWSEIKEKLK